MTHEIILQLHQKETQIGLPVAEHCDAPSMLHDSDSTLEIISHPLMAENIYAKLLCPKAGPEHTAA